MSSTNVMPSSKSMLSVKRYDGRLIYENERTQHTAKHDTQQIFIDMSGMSVGRIATIIANILNNKYDFDYSPHVKNKYRIVLYNCDKFILTGNKLENRIYSKHTGYPGGLKTISSEDLYEANPRTYFEKVIGRMLNKNRTRQNHLNRIRYINELTQEIAKHRKNDHAVQKAVDMSIQNYLESKNKQRGTK